jgi:signal recognition particle receptor subunit beta
MVSWRAVALFDYAAGEVLAKIVYYGPDGAGRTTNLRHIHDKLSPSNRGELATLNTEASSTLLFDFLPAEAGRVRGLRMRVQLCAFAKPVLSPPARRSLLKGADAVVFVANSEASATEANEQSLDDLHRGLTRPRGEPPVPVVIQYNKRDLATATSLETLGQKLNQDALPALSAIAVQGVGVDETLRVVTRLCYRALVTLYGEAGEPLAAGGLVPTPQPLGRSDTLPATPFEAPPRRPTEQSLARKSMTTTPGAVEGPRSATVKFTKHELLQKLRTEAEAGPDAPPKRGPNK